MYEPGWNPYYADAATQAIEARWAEEERLSEAADVLAEELARATLAGQGDCLPSGEYDRALRAYPGDAAAMDAELDDVLAGAEPSDALVAAFTAANMAEAYRQLRA